MYWSIHEPFVLAIKTFKKDSCSATPVLWRLEQDSCPSKGTGIHDQVKVYQSCLN